MHIDCSRCGHGNCEYFCNSECPILQMLSYHCEFVNVMTVCYIFCGARKLDNNDDDDEKKSHSV